MLELPQFDFIIEEKLHRDYFTFYGIKNERSNMNIPILVAALLTLFAFFAHAFIGDKEYQALKPDETDPEKINETWVQTRSGWHWVSVDLLLSSVALFIIAITEIIQSKKEILLLLAIYFMTCGVVWFVTVWLSKSSNKQLLTLGQWVFCFIMSGLILWGRQSA